MTGRRSRSGRGGQNDRIPQRVEQAAQAMSSNASSSGPRRGYIPETPVSFRPSQAPQNGWQQNPGQAYPPQNGWTQTGIQQRAQQQTQNFNSNPNTGNGYHPVTGAQRGYYVPAPVQTPQKPKRKKSHSVAAVIAALLLFAGLGTGGYFALSHYQRTKMVNEAVEPYNNLFCNGVYVDGIHLGGMTPEQAMNSVQSQIKQRHDAWSVQLVYNGSVMAEINSDMLGFNVDPSEVLNQAWMQGHTGDNEQRYNDMLLLEQQPYRAYTARPDGNTQAIDTKLAEIKQSIDTPATDAAMVAFDPSQPYPFVMTDEAYGKVLDTEPVKTRLYEMVSTLESGTIELVPARIEPNVRKADLMQHYMLRSSVYTPIDKHSTENRNMNIQRAFDFINGYVLQPGKSFSFNNVVGERTEANGFYPAIEYVYGEHVEGYGGGVCQASTTLYQAAVCAGLKIRKREPHSDSVSYTEYGKDATVYWVGKRKIDLVFENNTDEPIYIVAAVQQDPGNRKRLISKVSIYGQDMGDVRYELEAEVVETLPAPFNPVYVKDTSATYVVYKDQQESVSKAKEGYVVNSYRVKYEGSVQTERVLLYTDTYEPKPEKIYVGTKDR